MRTQWIRIYYAQDENKVNQHSFYVGYFMHGGGVTDRIVSFDIDDRTTFSQLRKMVCWRECNGSYRRPVPLYAELLEAMKGQCCTKNVHKYSKHELLDFRFGVLDQFQNGNVDAKDDHDNDDDKGKQRDRNHKKQDEGVECNALPQIIRLEVEDEPIDQIIPCGKTSNKSSFA